MFLFLLSYIIIILLTAQDKYVHNAYYAKYRCMEMSRMYFHDIWTSQILTVFTEIKAKYR